MSLVVPPGFGSAALIFTGSPGTQPYVTTIGVGLQDAGGDYVEVANKVMSSYAVAFANQWSSNLILERCSLFVGADGPSGSVDSDIPPVNSTRTGTFPPTAQSCIVRKVTNRLGRPGRGRMFLPGVLSEAEVDENGGVVTARRNAINGLAANFLTNLINTSPTWEFALEPVVLHGPSVTLNPPDPITGLVCSNYVGWIRGRIR